MGEGERSVTADVLNGIKEVKELPESDMILLNKEWRINGVEKVVEYLSRGGALREQGEAPSLV